MRANGHEAAFGTSAQLRGQGVILVDVVRVRCSTLGNVSCQTVTVIFRAPATTRRSAAAVHRPGTAPCQASRRRPVRGDEAVMPWEDFTASVTEAQRLAQPEGFDFLHRIGESYATLRRYAPEFLDEALVTGSPGVHDLYRRCGVLLAARGHTNTRQRARGSNIVRGRALLSRSQPL